MPKFPRPNSLSFINSLLGISHFPPFSPILLLDRGLIHSSASKHASPRCSFLLQAATSSAKLLYLYLVKYLDNEHAITKIQETYYWGKFIFVHLISIDLLLFCSLNPKLSFSFILKNQVVLVKELIILVLPSLDWQCIWTVLFFAFSDKKGSMYIHVKLKIIQRFCTADVSKKPAWTNKGFVLVW